MIDPNVERVKERLTHRAIKGRLKYGCTTERNDLSTTEWLRHLQEELMDGIVYIEAVLARTAASNE